jgi:hypothetical protein
VRAQFRLFCALNVSQHGLTAAREAVGLALKCMREALTAEPSIELMQVTLRHSSLGVPASNVLTFLSQDVAGCARQCHEVSSTTSAADLTKEAERYRWATHLMRMRLTCGSNRGAGLEQLSCKAAVACARYCDILPADRVFMEAGVQVLPGACSAFVLRPLTPLSRSPAPIRTTRLRSAF